MSIQQAIDNKPLIQQIVTNLLAGKSSDNIFEQTGYISTDINLPARNFIQALLFIWFNNPQRDCDWRFRKSFLSSMGLLTSLDFLSKLPKEHYNLLPPYVLTKVKQHNSTYVKQLQFDDFDYAVAYQKIESAKLVYELEVLLRDYSLGSYNISQLNLLECINSYKALTFALKRFKDKSRKSLPDFIHASVAHFENRITNLVLNHPITYDQFIDCFQFKSGIIKCDIQYNVGYAILKSFALIVGTNPQPYTFDWNYYSSPTYRELIDSWTSRIIELEHFKQQNQLIDNTIIEHELTKLYSEVNPDPVQVANAHDFIKQIDQVYDTIKSKLI